MSLFISALYVQPRHGGQAGPLILDGKVAFTCATSPGEGHAKLSAFHEFIRSGSKEGTILRAAYSQAVFMLDNVIHSTYEFPDLGKLTLQEQVTMAQTALLEVERLEAYRKGCPTFAGATEALATIRKQIIAAQGSECSRENELSIPAVVPQPPEVALLPEASAGGGMAAAGRRLARRP